MCHLFSLMKTLKEASPPDAKRGKFHLIGHSLGAHISGRAAHVIKENERNSSDPWIASRVTGLDPAQPCFQTKDPALKLTNDDAAYVDIYHTNARQLLFFGLGLSQQLGMHALNLVKKTFFFYFIRFFLITIL